MISTGPVLASLWFVAAGTAVVVAAVRLAWAVSEGRLDRALVTVLVVILQVVGVGLVLGMIGILSPIPVLIAHLAIAAAVLAMVRVPAVEPQPSPTVPLMDRVTTIASAGVGSALVVAAAVPTVRGLTSLQSETRHYHASAVVDWLTRHNIWRLPFELAGWFTSTNPGNGEMLGLWLTLPTHRMELSFLMNIPVGALLVIASSFLASELGGSPSIGALAAMAVVAAPITWGTQVHGLATDLTAMAGLVCAVGLVVRAARSEEPARWLLLAGGALGLAVGAKYTVAIPAVALIVFTVWRFRSLVPTVRLLPGLVAFAGPWLLRNELVTHNPIFPQRVALGGFVLFPGARGASRGYFTTIAAHIKDGHTAIVHTWARAAIHSFGVPILVLAGAGIVWALVRGTRGHGRALALVALVCIAAYFVTPLTGGGAAGQPNIIGSNLRYALPGLLLAIVIGAAALPRWIAGVLAVAGVAWGAWRLLHGAGVRADLHLTAGAIVAVLLVAVVAAAAVALRPPTPAGGVRFVAAGLILVLAWVGTAALIHRRDGRDAPTRLDRAISLAWQPGRPILVLGARDFLSIFGRRLGRPTITLAQGGRAHEIAFRSASELDAAVERTGADVIVVRVTRRDASLELTMPPGWTPPAGWCRVGGDAAASVFVRQGFRGVAC